MNNNINNNNDNNDNNNNNHDNNYDNDDIIRIRIGILPIVLIIINVIVVN